jgi:hypothetical protein
LKTLDLRGENPSSYSPVSYFFASWRLGVRFLWARATLGALPLLCFD